MPMPNTDSDISGCLPCGWLKKKRAVRQDFPGPTKTGQEQRTKAKVEVPKPPEKTSETKEIKNNDVPTNMDYAIESTRKALAILRGIADVVKFPLVKEVIELGISILDTCQAIDDVQSGVQRLRDRIASLLLSVAVFTKEAEESDRLVEDLGNLKQCLALIIRRLNAITSQDVFKTTFLSEANLRMISDCEKDFRDSVDRFQLLRNLETGQNVVLLQQQLSKFYGISMDMADSVETIKHEVKDIKSILIERMSMPKTTSASIRMPPPAGQLFGREEVVKRIAERLSSSDPRHSRVCILGPGGMGKTSTALAVMHHQLIKATFGEDRYWIPCTHANSIDNFMAILYQHVKAENRTGDLLEDIITTLQETDKHRVILFDNFESLWRKIPDAENTIKPILAHLDAIPNISILMTMRSEWAPLDSWDCEYLDPIKPDESQSLYTSIHVDAANHPDHLKQLLDALGHMPYAITLMASRGKKSEAKPEKPLHEWNTVGTDMLSKSAEGINRCIELSIESDYLRGSRDATRILQVLSMLPAGVHQEDLGIWAGEWSSQAIEALRDTALIVTRPASVSTNKTTSHYSVLPVVQSYMAQRDRIPPQIRKSVLEACYRFLVDNNATVEGPNTSLFKKHVAAIASQEANIQALLTDAIKTQLLSPISSSPFTNHLDAFVAYINYQFWARPRSEIAEMVVFLARKLNARQHEAAALFCLGRILWRLEKYDHSREAFELAYKAYEGVEDNLMALWSQLKQVHVDISRGVAIGELEAFFDVIQLRWKNTLDSSTMGAAILSFYRGFITSFKGSYEEALLLLREAGATFERLGKLDEETDCLFLMARCYAAMQDFNTAIQVIDTWIKIFGDLFGDGPKGPDMVDACLLRVRYLKGAGHWGDEMETTLAVTLQASRELGLSNTIASLLLEIGEVHIYRGELGAARDAYIEAIRRCHGLGGWTEKGMVEAAQHNLSYIDYLHSRSQRLEVSLNEVNSWIPIRY